MKACVYKHPSPEICSEHFCFEIPLRLRIETFEPFQGFFFFAKLKRDVLALFLKRSHVFLPNGKMPRPFAPRWHSRCDACHRHGGRRRRRSQGEPAHRQRDCRRGGGCSRCTPRRLFAFKKFLSIRFRASSRRHRSSGPAGGEANLKNTHACQDRGGSGPV